MEKEQLEKLIKLVDEFVAQLKKDLLSVEYKPTTGVLPRVWDRMKNWWYNTVLKKGANDPNNPYIYKNKFGALGHEAEESSAEKETKTESKRLTLYQYNFIKEQYKNLEKDLSYLNEDTAMESENLKKLKLFRIIDGWATKFKQEIIKQFSSSADAEKPTTDPASSSAAPSTAPMEAAPSGDTSAPEVATRRGRGRPKKTRIYWSESGWGPRSADGSLPDRSIKWIKDKVFERLSSKKEDLPDFEKTFEQDFKKALEDILVSNEEELKSYPDEVKKVENTKNKWEGFLVNHVADKLEIILISRELDLNWD